MGQFQAVQCRIGALNLAEHRSCLRNPIAFILLTCAPAVPAQVHQSDHPGITAKGLEAAPAAGGAAHTEDATMRPSGGSGDQVVPGGGNSSGFTSSNARPATGGAALQ